MRTGFSLVLAAACVSLVAGSADLQAQDSTEIGIFGDWTAYSVNGPDGKMCFMSSQPKKAEGAYKKRGNPFVFVTHRPYAGTVDEISVSAGYTFQPGSGVKVNIGSKAYELFTEDDTAWAPDGDSDRALIKAMKRGNRMVVRGVSSRGTKTKDTYSLMGFTKAHRAISRACDVKS